jgi:hypothetical protein
VTRGYRVRKHRKFESKETYQIVIRGFVLPAPVVRASAALLLLT